MRIAIIPTDDVQLLSELDKRMFNDYDAFEPEDFLDYACFLVQIDGEFIGSVVLQDNFTVGTGFDGKETAELGTLYIVSTGIIPQYQGRGIGKIVKAWEVGYARGRGFKRVVTNVRQNNQRAINLNNRFGFVSTRTIPNYYDDGENSIVMELAL